MVPELASIPDAVHREASFALTLGAALFGATAGTLVFGPGLTPFAMLVVLGVLGWLASDPQGSVVRLAGWCGLASALALGPARGLDLSGLLGALPFIGPATLALLVLALTLFAPLRALAAAESHEDGALAAIVASRWLLTVAALTSLAAGVVGDVALGVAGGLVLLFAAIRWVLGRDAQTSLRRWLDRCRAEDSPRWRVVDRAAVDPTALTALRPLVRAEPHDGVLVSAAPTGPYRGEGAPIALVPRTVSHDQPVGWSLPWRDVGYAVGLVIAVGAPMPCTVLGLMVQLAFTPRVVDHELGMGFIGIGAVFAIACIGVGSLLATERKKTVWIAGLVTVALTALGAAVLNGL